MIPEGWQQNRLSDLADIKFSNVDKKSHEDEQPVKLCNYTDVYYNSRITNHIPFMHATAKEREVEKFSLQQGDVIFTKDSETPEDIAVPSFVSEPLENVLCGYHLTLLRPHEGISSGEYLSHLFGLPSVQHHFYVLANGITRFGLTSDAVTKTPIVHPPLPEQKKIAAILTSVDEAIEKQEAQIAKLQNLKKAMMQELLTKGIGHTEFKDSPVGRIPKVWETRPFSELVNIKHGFAFSGEFFTSMPTEFILLTPGNFHVNGSLYFGRNTKYYSGSVPNEYVLENGDLLVVMTDLTKEMAILGNAVLMKSSQPVLHNQRIGKVLIKENNHNHVIKPYLCLLFNSTHVKNHVKNTATGTTVRHTSPTKMLEPLVPVPTKNEQEKIVSILASVADNIEATQKKLAHTKSLKKALMQDLLTGKVRVKVVE
jgi:type I restriction enzyme S subunit